MRYLIAVLLLYALAAAQTVDVKARVSVNDLGFHQPLVGGGVAADLIILEYSEMAASAKDQDCALASGFRENSSCTTGTTTTATQLGNLVVIGVYFEDHVNLRAASEAAPRRRGLVIE